MRLWLPTFGILAAMVAPGHPAGAENYPWCAYYGGDMGGENCGFSTYEQCMATISGIGGFCDRNTQYALPAVPIPRSRAPRSHRAPHKHQRHS